MRAIALALFLGLTSIELAIKKLADSDYKIGDIEAIIMLLAFVGFCICVIDGK